MDDSVARTPHADHDLLLIAAGIDPAADPAARAAAGRQSASCTECDELARDLRAIAAGLRSLPRSISVPAARDFRIMPDQARRLQRGHGLRRLLRPFGAGGMPSLRPVAAAFTTLGVAGLLFTVVLPGMSTFQATTGSAPAAVSGPGAAGAAASIATSKENASTSLPKAPGGAAASPRPADLSVASSARPIPQVPSVSPATPVVSASGWSPAAVLSLLLLAVGVFLFTLRLAAQRLR